jgi:hypothetical protein
MKLSVLNTLFLFLALAGCTGCGNDMSQDDRSREKVPLNAVTSASTLPEIKVGGLYISRQKDGTYLVSKVIAMDDFAVHIRIYQDQFKEKPAHLSSDSLKVMIGHAPLDKNGFWTDHPELLNVEAVKESELEGYKLYLDEMSKH